MKKVCSIFCTVTFWLALVGMILFIAGGLIVILAANPIATEMVNKDATLDFDAVLISIYSIGAALICCSFYYIGALVVCPLTKKRLAVAKSRREMIPLGILSVIFGSIVSAVMIFVMPDRYYQDAKVADPNEELSSNE